MREQFDRMRKSAAKIMFFVVQLLALIGVLSVSIGAGSQKSGPYLSPEEVVADNARKRIYIAESTASRVAIFDIKTRKVVKTIPLPNDPSGIAVSRDGLYLYVTGNSSSGRVFVVDLRSGKVDMSIPTGHAPMSPVISPNGKTLYVCNEFDNNVVAINLSTKTISARIPVKRFPSAAAVTPDGKSLVVANLLTAEPATAESVSSVVSIIDTARKVVIAHIQLPNGSNALRGVCVSPDGKYVYVTHIIGRYQLPTTQLERGWMNTNALSIIDIRKCKLVNTVLLDDVTLGAANPWGVACTGDGKLICVTHSGTHEMSVIDRTKLHEKLLDAPDDTLSDLSFLDGIRHRIRLSGNGPRGIAVVGSKAYVADYFSDSLEICDLDQGSYGKPSLLALGPQKPMVPVRQGEMLFNDASNCFQKWQSCASCHPDARSDGLNWDLMNDGLGNPKNSKSMLLSHKTPPVMSLGIRSNAEAAVHAGFRYIEFTDRPRTDEEAVDEYLKSLRPVQSPFLLNGKLSDSSRRGERIFLSAGCSSCHRPPLYTDLQKYDIGTGTGMDDGKKFDTPTLIECWRTAPYLHDGRAANLKDIFRRFNPEDRHGVTSHLTDKELNDLAEFVSSL